jgi:hypothetical protein
MNLSDYYNYSGILSIIFINVSISVIVLLIKYHKFYHYSKLINQIPGPKARNIFIGNLDIFYASAKTKHWFQSKFCYQYFVCI